MSLVRAEDMFLWKIDEPNWSPMPGDSQSGKVITGICVKRYPSHSRRNPGPALVITKGNERYFTVNNLGSDWAECKILLPPGCKYTTGNYGLVISGYEIRSSPVYSKADVNKVKADLTADFDNKIKALKDEQSVKLDEILISLRNASIDALKNASLEVLIDACATGVIDGMPDKLSTIIEDSVNQAVQRALQDID